MHTGMINNAEHTHENNISIQGCREKKGNIRLECSLVH
jgi:hypothetical protein